MPVEMRKVMAVFLTVIALWFSCHSKRSKNILVKVLSGMFSLENVASWKWRTNPVVGICQRYCTKFVFLTENKNGPIMFGTLYYNLNYFLNVCWKLFCTCT